MIETTATVPRTTISGDEGIATSKVVTTVFEAILADINEGRLLPGQKISDTNLAESFGVSRTPVREAIQRLREIGLVEASANRFTRVAVVSPQQTADAMTVWIALYAALIEEVVPVATDELVEQLNADHAAFQDAVAKLDVQSIATTNFQFFNRMSVVSHNPELRRAIRSVVHMVRLGSLHLPEFIDLTALDQAQTELLDATRKRDLEKARAALGVIRGIRIPQ